MKIATVAFLIATLVACGVTRQAREVKYSGFLGDYSILEPGPEGGAKLVYQNPNANIGSYTKIMLVPVTIWTGEGSEMNDLSAEDRKLVADRLFSVVHARLAKDYTMVGTPEPGAMRIAIAITTAESSYPVLDTVSTIVPIGLGISTLKAIATSKPAFVGEATGRRLWWVGDEFYWDTDHLSAEEIALEVWDRDRRREHRYERLRVVRAREEAATSARRERIPDDVRALVWARDGGQCVRCGAEDDLQFDHVIPVAKGGGNAHGNIQILCGNCNRAKSDRII